MYSFTTYIKLIRACKNLEIGVLVKNPIEYDRGGSGDYTVEKYEQPDYSIEDIMKMKEIV